MSTRPNPIILSKENPSLSGAASLNDSQWESHGSAAPRNIFAVPLD
jgi:hypothetical protein